MSDEKLCCLHQSVNQCNEPVLEGSDFCEVHNKKATLLTDDLGLNFIILNFLSKGKTFIAPVEVKEPRAQGVIKNVTPPTGD